MNRDAKTKKDQRFFFFGVFFRFGASFLQEAKYPCERAICVSYIPHISIGR